MTTSPTGTLVGGRVHEAPKIRSGRLVRPVGPIHGYCEDFKLWSPPRLTQKGRKFEPAWGKPGSTVWFDHDVTEEREGTDIVTGQQRTYIHVVETKRMSGQVWSEGPQAGSLWVVVDQIAYLVS